MSLASAQSAYSPPPHQCGVDAMMAAVRAELASGKRDLFKPPPPKPELSSNAIDQRVAEELEVIRRRLDQIGDALVSDPILVGRHGVTLQGIDLTNQVLAHLAEVIAAQDKKAAVEQVSMHDLKARLQRRPLSL
jgi:hypothetical protein